MQGRLSIVATPIGNLEDITLRALRTLRECDVILSEDTRVTKKLLAHFDIAKPLLSYHAHSGGEKVDKALLLLTEGRHLALVTDAGTPAISDPGAELVAAVHERLGESVHVEVVPGPSALAAALSLAGVPADRFVFMGFPPHKKGRKTFFEECARSPLPVVFYESPHRILKALDALDLTRRTVICRELTKIHEEVVHGTPPELLHYFETHPEKVRGEFVVIVEPRSG